MFQEVGLYDLKINGKWCPICNLTDCMENSYRTLRAFDETMQELQEYVELRVYDGVSSIDSEEEEKEIEKHVLNFYREKYTQDSCGLTRIHYFEFIFKELIEIESMMRQPERLNRSDDLNIDKIEKDRNFDKQIKTQYLKIWSQVPSCCNEQE